MKENYKNNDEDNTVLEEIEDGLIADDEVLKLYYILFFIK